HHGDIDIKLKMRQLGSDRLLALAQILIEIDHAVGCYWVGDALDLDMAALFAVDHVFDMGMGLVRDQYLSGRASGLEPSGEIHAGANDRIVHPSLAAEVSYGAHARIDTHPASQRVLHTRCSPNILQLFHLLAHRNRHLDASDSILLDAARLGIAKKNH